MRTALSVHRDELKTRPSILFPPLPLLAARDERRATPTRSTRERFNYFKGKRVRLNLPHVRDQPREHMRRERRSGTSHPAADKKSRDSFPTVFKSSRTRGRKAATSATFR